MKNIYEVKEVGTVWHVLRDGNLLVARDTKVEAEMFVVRYELMDAHLWPGWKAQAKAWGQA